MSVNKTKSGNVVKLNLSNKANASTNAWAILTPTDANQIIDEDSLLAKDNIKNNSISAVNLDDCGDGSGKRKACKDCTCGRAELENSVGLNDLDQAPSGGCGSCSLGDAFRCSTCPYLGQPAFDKNSGNAVKLKL